MRSKIMKKILFVDDNQDIGFSVKQSLEENKEDFTVDYVTSGKACLEYLKNNSLPDIIVLDIMMPLMNGWEVHTTLRNHPSWKRIPVIFLTAVTDSTSRMTGELLADAYVEKPIDPEKLGHLIKQILHKKYGGT